MTARPSLAQIRAQRRAALIRAANRLERDLNRKLRNTKVRIRVK